MLINNQSTEYVYEFTKKILGLHNDDNTWDICQMCGAKINEARKNC